MPQFDVRRMSGDRLLLECQADLLSHLNTRFVVPLSQPPRGLVAGRLNPLFDVGDRIVTMATQQAFAIPEKELGPIVASLANERDRIIGALDVLLKGV